MISYSSASNSCQALLPPPFGLPASALHLLSKERAAPLHVNVLQLPHGQAGPGDTSHSVVLTSRMQKGQRAVQPSGTSLWRIPRAQRLQHSLQEGAKLQNTQHSPEDVFAASTRQENPPGATSAVEKWSMRAMKAAGSYLCLTSHGFITDLAPELSLQQFRPWCLVNKYFW